MFSPIRLLLPAALFLTSVPPFASAQPLTAMIDSTQSTVSYTGRSVGHGWTGTSRHVTGRLHVDRHAPDAGRLIVETAVARFDSGNRRRDATMRRTVAAGRHPSVRFEADRIAVTTRAAAGDIVASTWRVHGRLTFHGQTHPLTVPADVQIRGDRLTAEARFPVSLTRYGIDRPRLLFVPIDDTIRVAVDLVATLDPPAAQARR